MQEQAKDLRSFLADVKRLHPEELVTIEREMDLRFEISALHVKLDRAHKFPITLFKKLRDVEGNPCAFPLLSNLFASRGLCALALESSVERVGLDYDARSQELKTPTVVGRSEAPVKQIVKKGDDVNLYSFPVPLPYHMEGGRTILGSVITTVDNHEGNVYNCAYQTLRLLGPRKVTVGLGEGTHTGSATESGLRTPAKDCRRSSGWGITRRPAWARSRGCPSTSTNIPSSAARWANRSGSRRRRPGAKNFLYRRTPRSSSKGSSHPRSAGATACAQISRVTIRRRRSGR
jgi:hypothetical protein